MTYRELYCYGIEQLEKVGIEEAVLDARRLLEHCANISYQDLLAHGNRTVTEDIISLYESMIQQRKQRIPLQYITEVQEFMGLNFRVSKDVLIPRQDTEMLVEEVLKYKQDGMHFLDLCTGSGCILLSLLHYGNTDIGVGVDISPKALEIAAYNKEHILIHEKEKRATLICSDLFENVEGKFDFIVSNPPYIETSVIDTLMPEVKKYEPMMALDGREDGLYFYRKIIEQASHYLAREGMLFFEIGEAQGKAVSIMMQEAGFRDVEIIKDYAHKERVVKGLLIQNK